MQTRLTLRPGQPGTRKLVERYGERLLDDDVVYVRIGYHATELRARAKRLGVIWRQPRKLWEITYRDTKNLGIEDRIVETGGRELSITRCMPAYGAIY